MSVTSYYVDKDERHIESGTGRVLSTKESRALEDIPEWKKFEIGRLEDVDGHTVPGPNAMQVDINQYSKNIAKTNLHKTRYKNMSAKRKMDWDVITGWEKRIKVDFGSIGPNHVRWSHWTHKERDIVARKVHECELIKQDHGPQSNRMKDWAKENAPIMIDFARDHKPMPDWAHAEYRDSGVPEYVKVVWKRIGNNDITSKGDWAYDPPGPWKDKGEEPAWSSKPKDSDYDPDIEAANRYRKSVGMSPVEKSQSEKLRAALLEANERPDVVVKELNPQTGQLEVIQETQVKTKIMPSDTRFTDLQKAMNWASETHHGKAHQNRWNRVAATMGADNGYDPYSYDEVKEIWEKFNKNARWTVAINWFDVEDENVEEMHHYHNAPPCQRHYTAEEFEKNWNQKPEIVNIEGWDFQMIIDPVIREPLYQLDGKGYPSSTWAYENGNWIRKNAFGPGPHDKGYEEPVQEEITFDLPTDRTSSTNEVPDAVIEALPEMTEKEANEFYAQYKGDTIEWVTQRAPSVGPHVTSVLFHNGKPAYKKASRFSEFADLPFWTKAQAENYFIKVMKLGSYSRRSLDGHWNTVKGYCTPNTVDPIALAATQQMEDIEANLNEAMQANDWAEVVRLVKWLETTENETKDV